MKKEHETNSGIKIEIQRFFKEGGIQYLRIDPPYIFGRVEEKNIFVATSHLDENLFSTKYVILLYKIIPILKKYKIKLEVGFQPNKFPYYDGKNLILYKYKETKAVRKIKIKL